MTTGKEGHQQGGERPKRDAMGKAERKVPAPAPDHYSQASIELPGMKKYSPPFPPPASPRSPPLPLVPAAPFLCSFHPILGGWGGGRFLLAPLGVSECGGLTTDMAVQQERFTR